MAATWVEQCRCRVGAMWYAEEAELLEEMRRVWAFLEWDRNQLNNRTLHVRQADTTPHPPTPSPSRRKTATFEEGLRVYALCLHSAAPV
jgi:hypothetical protein